MSLGIAPSTPILRYQKLFSYITGLKIPYTRRKQSPRFMEDNRPANSRWLASCHRFLSLSPGCAGTESYPSGGIGLRTKALARVAALLRGASSLHFRQNGRWHKISPDRVCSARCISSLPHWGPRAVGILGASWFNAGRFRNLSE